MTNDKMLTRIGNLLRQAEGTDNQAEAEAFTETAQRLATAHSINLELARAKAGARDKAPTPMQRMCTIGERGTKGLRTYIALMSTIAGANDVRIDVASNSTFVIQFGFESDIETVNALYSSLVVQMVKATDVYLRSGDWQRTRIQREVHGRDDYGRRVAYLEQKAPTKLQARLEFQTGYAVHIGERLTAAREQAARDVDAANADSSDSPVSAELVLRGKEVAVGDYYSQTSNARGKYRGGRSRTYGAAARKAGADAAATAQLTDQASLGGSARELTA